MFGCGNRFELLFSDDDDADNNSEELTSKNLKKCGDVPKKAESKTMENSAASGNVKPENGTDEFKEWCVEKNRKQYRQEKKMVKVETNGSALHENRDKQLRNRFGSGRNYVNRNGNGDSQENISVNYERQIPNRKDGRKLLYRENFVDKNQNEPNVQNQPNVESCANDQNESPECETEIDMEKSVVVDQEKEENVLTWYEWKSKNEQRPKPQYNLRKAGEGEDVSKWNKWVPLNKKSTEDSEEKWEYDPNMCPRRVGRLRRIVDITFNFNEERMRVKRRISANNVNLKSDGSKVVNVFGGNSGKGGVRVGVGRGRGGDGFNRFRRLNGNCPNRNIRATEKKIDEEIPKVDDETQFPLLISAAK